jgi:C-terminal processing protease CtpA/Prc
LKLLVIMVSVVGLFMIWTVGEGDASQALLQDVVYGQDLYVQATNAGDMDDSRSKHSLAYYTKLMADIAYKIHNRYMEDVDPEQLIESGINGMLDDLDPYSVVLKRKSYDALMENTHGKYEGVDIPSVETESIFIILSPA